MSVAQFDALLAELEPCIKKTTDFCELCVQGSICSALFCKMKWVNLTIAILDFGACLYGGSERSKHLSKCLLRMRQNVTRYNFFYDVRIFRRQCVQDWQSSSSSSSSPLLSLVQVPAKLAINLSIHTQHTYDNGVDRTGRQGIKKNTAFTWGERGGKKKCF